MKNKHKRIANMPILQNPAQAALWLGVLLIVVMALSACSPTRTLNAVVPSGSYYSQLPAVS